MELPGSNPEAETGRGAATGSHGLREVFALGLQPVLVIIFGEAPEIDTNPCVTYPIRTDPAPQGTLFSHRPHVRKQLQGVRPLRMPPLANRVRARRAELSI